MRGWVILIGAFLVGAVVGAGLMSKGSELITPYLPKAVSASGERLEGQVVRKQREGNRLLVKVSTPQGPMLVTFTERVADLDVLLESGDTVNSADSPLRDVRPRSGPRTGQGAIPRAVVSATAVNTAMTE